MNTLVAVAIAAIASALNTMVVCLGSPSKGFQN